MFPFGPDFSRGSLLGALGLGCRRVGLDPGASDGARKGRPQTLFPSLQLLRDHRGTRVHVALPL